MLGINLGLGKFLNTALLNIPFFILISHFGKSPKELGIYLNPCLVATTNFSCTSGEDILVMELSEPKRRTYAAFTSGNACCDGRFTITPRVRLKLAHLIHQHNLMLIEGGKEFKSFDPVGHQQCRISADLWSSEDKQL